MANCVNSKYSKPDVFDVTCVNSESYRLLDWIKEKIEDCKIEMERWEQLEKVISASIEREYEKSQDSQLGV